MLIIQEGVWHEGTKAQKIALDINDTNIRKQIDAAKAWIEKSYTKKDRICKRSTSYGMKDKAERDSGIYICNGAFIVAMQELGFECEHKSETLNCYFNVKSVAK